MPLHWLLPANFRRIDLARSGGSNPRLLIHRLLRGRHP
jgi:hypothetical protein